MLAGLLETKEGKPGFKSGLKQQKNHTPTLTNVSSGSTDHSSTGFWPKPGASCRSSFAGGATTCSPASLRSPARGGSACPLGPGTAVSPARAAPAEGPGAARGRASPHRDGTQLRMPRTWPGSPHRPPPVRPARRSCRSPLPNLSVIRNPLIPHDWT